LAICPVFSPPATVFTDNICAVLIPVASSILSFSLINIWEILFVFAMRAQYISK